MVYLKCRVCKGWTKMFEKHDAYYCPKCNRWIEPICDDPTCEYCKERPKKPLQETDERGKE